MLHADGPAPRFGSCYFLLSPRVSLEYLPENPEVNNVVIEDENLMREYEAKVRAEEDEIWKNIISDF